MNCRPTDVGNFIRSVSSLENGVMRLAV